MLLLFSGILVFILLSEYSPRSHFAGEVDQGPAFGVRPVTLMNNTESVRVFDVCLVDVPPGLEQIPITCNVKIAEVGRYAGGFNGQIIQAHYEGVSLFNSNTLSIQKAGNYRLEIEKCESLQIALLATPACIIFSVGNEWKDPTAAPSFRRIGSFHLTPYNKPSSGVFLYVLLLVSLLGLSIVGLARNRKLSAVEVNKAVKREAQFEMDWDSTEGDNDTVSELKVPLPENEKDWRDLFDKIYQEGGSGSKLLPTSEDTAASRRESDGTSFLNDYWKM